MGDFGALSELSNLVPLVGLYAETHYRFRCFPFSLYYRRAPEIIFDAPHRLEPGCSLPVTLIIRDAHRFPVELEEITIRISGHEGKSEQSLTLGERISTPLWGRVFDVDVNAFPPGVVTLDCTLRGRCGRKRFQVSNDNHPGLSHAPLQVRKLADPLPDLPGWYAGELHCHTEFGPDHVEFGAPLEAMIAAAPALGLKWIALTDHSYNLDDFEDDFLHDDPALLKWKRFHREVDRLNAESDGVVLIPGEEATCRSSSGRNIHMLILGNREFIPGSGDGAQKWFRTRSEMTVREALKRIDADSFAAAAHPFDEVGILEKLLVGRGSWTDKDLHQTRLDGWQLLNDTPGDSFRHGLEKWKEALLQGMRINIFAGNDAHGNFNRFRQVRLPMVRLWEKQAHLFGRVTTRVKLDRPPTVSGIISALKAGRAIISDGPALEIEVIRDAESSPKSSSVEDGKMTVRLRYKSSVDFGRLDRLKLLTGDSGGEREVLGLSEDNGDSPGAYAGEVSIEADPGLYLRAELTTKLGTGYSHTALTNPIWVEPETGTLKLL